MAPALKFSRRDLLAVASAALLPQTAPAAAIEDRTLAFLARRRNPDGGYCWSIGDPSHITPTFAAVGCYRALGRAVPEASEVARFAGSNYPVAETRRTDRPLWRFDFEQAQTLLWLDQPVAPLRALAGKWLKPAEFTKTYELDGNPVFQHQAMAVSLRRMVGIDSSGPAGDAWRNYFAERRRTNGTYNQTPASDGSAGHVLNTVWGIWASDALNVSTAVSPELAGWVQDCQLPSGGFTYAPGAPLGGVEDVIYTWAALWLLDRVGRQPRRKPDCLRWLASLASGEGGYRDCAAGVPNATATYYALECFKLLGVAPAAAGSRRQESMRPFPSGARVFTIQIEAPGAGSPSDAVHLADKLGIHIWAAKNCAAGWIATAQKIADARKVAVQFAAGDEEYGTFVAVPGLGTYSHLVDLVAPGGRDFGAPAAKKNFAYPWPGFRDTRIRQLRAAGGRLVWQFNENEELTRALLDEALAGQTYSAISSFHFGRENFLESQPFLQRWLGRIPMVALQDAHGTEPWWWGDWLTGFRTLFIAREPTWEAWLGALERSHVAAVRRDAITKGELQLAGPQPVRDFLMARQNQWCWWGRDGETRERPAAAFTVLRPGMPFEAGAPSEGSAVRIRLWSDNTGQGVPRAPRAELVSLQMDGRDMTPREVTAASDRYLICPVPSGAQRVAARVRALDSRKETVWNASLV